MSGTAGWGDEEGRREGGTRGDGPRSRAAQTDSSTPVPSLTAFPFLFAALEGGRERANVPSHLWGKCSGDGALHPALIYLLGSGSLGQLVFMSAGAWNFC